MTIVVLGDQRDAITASEYFHPLEVVDGVSETQLQVGENSDQQNSDPRYICGAAVASVCGQRP